MQNIAGKITIGNTTLRLGKNSRIVALDVQSALGIPVHRCQIMVDAAAGITAKPGERVKVELGYDAQVNRIFTGRLTVGRGTQLRARVGDDISLAWKTS